jgi:hypothetical protein
MPKKSSSPTSSKAGEKSSREQQSTLRRVTLYLKPQVARDLRIRCAEEDITVSSWLAGLVHERLYPERKTRSR